MVWKTHPLYKEYEVSTNGKVRRVTKGRGAVVGRILADAANSYGYKVVALCSVGKPKTFFVHVLMLETFVSLRPTALEALHKNDIKDDNRIKNLSWGTHQDNYRDRVRHGGGNHGSRHGLSKLIETKILSIRKRYAMKTASTKMLGVEFGVSETCIKNVVNRKTWRHV